ncbi:hypothetical protein SAMN04488030_1453 [Aliiroseovarius halocynthiae]|uniref:Lipoprotein n=1 Tax=Aliiroseovarius halocynthiae TaxID=985055 RepID=A0A545SWI4_9RHOB|nr:hypothetical protein [Aliiroseovarius halocynthiae]TQV69327.1 hypothetical protein FIL88_07175 [Aliiroseovarius halocynthiae]SMR72107.1 hypothetical protein SAMN04488030_1453 [Aliiroseovarius halocynthiae]
MIFRRIAAPALLTASLLALTACGGSANLNPLGWFRSGGVKEVAVIPEGGFLDEQENRGLVADVVELQVLRTQGGAIIRAKGLPPRLGYWNAELVPENFERPENGTLTYMFRITEPYYRTETGRPRQRDVYVGRFVSDTKLRGVRTIRVVGANNTQSARR